MMKWLGSKPTYCQLCEDKLTDSFVDGKTIAGPWAMLCEDCYAYQGIGLGIGKGQLYKLTDGEWIKMEETNGTM